MTKINLIAVVLISVLHAQLASATVTEYGTWQISEWQNAAGDYTSIGFTGWPTFTLITDQYASLGVVFPSDDCQVQWISNNPFFPMAPA